MINKNFDSMLFKTLNLFTSRHPNGITTFKHDNAYSPFTIYNPQTQKENMKDEECKDALTQKNSLISTEDKSKINNSIKNYIEPAKRLRLRDTDMAVNKKRKASADAGYGSFETDRSPSNSTPFLGFSPVNKDSYCSSPIDLDCKQSNKIFLEENSDKKDFNENLKENVKNFNVSSKYEVNKNSRRNSLESPFRGFSPVEKSVGQSRDIQTTNCYNNDLEKSLQEQADHEFALKLHEELNATTRSSVRETRKRKRQTTLEEMVRPKLSKVGKRK